MRTRGSLEMSGGGVKGTAAPSKGRVGVPPEVGDVGDVKFRGG